MSVRAAIQKVVDGGTLTREEAVAAMDAIMTGEASGAQIGALVTALRMRGETEEEIAGFAESMRRHALSVPRATSDALVDTCGTGGDGAHTFNISTAAAFVVAGAGVRVAKHGNRAMTSRCGSADVLEGLGVRVDLTPDAVARCIDEVGIGFMYAPVFHPAMRHAGPARKEIGIRTVFNLLGPLTNPAAAQHQIVGVADATVADKLARVLGLLGTRHALVVHSHDGLDELSISAPTQVSEVRVNGGVEVRRYELSPEEVGLPTAPLSAVRGGDVEDNVAIIRHVLNGGNGPARAITLLNAAAALYAADAVGSIAEGVQAAAESIDSGAAAAKLTELAALSHRLAEA
ncbi:anthranilate phosphoribosyltransferase [Sphaerobacter sp.]|uniref:anthranilate phosphoribosyltransferase n=1 Tax=Sphaerobacter sp. TaxID=2099654 RepID=UPI001DA0DAC6|nr:anthranilate phosphoribosyltransferase [Sphaerobacter sp.]MBX5446566.1 anthranilate phosphoribosyltransferase [Sphaerobacter sp.]